MKLHSNTYDWYKDAEGEWSKTIPSEWQETRVKDLFRLTSDAAPTDNDYELLSLYAGIGVRPRKELEARGNKASSTDGYWIVKKNDIVVNKLLAWMGSVGLSEYDGVTSPAYDVLRQVQPDIDPRYFAYLFRTEIAKKIFRKNSRGIMDMRLRLYFDKLGAITVPVPPYKDQQAISDYIDHKVGQIDKKVAILKKKKLLQEKLKKSLIHKVVTKGLNNNVKLKETDIEWIGDIPETWEIKRIKDITLVKRGGSPRPIDDPKYFDKEGEFSWVRIADLTASDRYLVATKEKLSSLGAKYSVKRYPGQFILSIAGTVGKPIITKIKCCIHDGFVWFPSLKIDPEYLYYIFSTGLPYLGLGKLGTQLNLNTETVGLISIPLPPEENIKELIEFLDEKTTLMNKAINTIDKQIEKLLELKIALICDSVTGKINVSNVNTTEKDFAE